MNQGQPDMSGNREEISREKLGEPGDHDHLWAIVIRRPTDFEPYGFRIRDGADCSCGRKWFLPLECMPYDWGVCANPGSPRCGLLTFEHMGCPQFEAQPDEQSGGAGAQFQGGE
jgi:hypothetical protein